MNEESKVESQEIEVHHLVIVGEKTDTKELFISIEADISTEEAIEKLYEAIDALEEILQEEQ